MERFDWKISFIWMALGVVQCIESWRIGLGSVSEPAMGFIPFVLGMVIIGLSAVLLAESSLAMKKTSGRGIRLWAGVNWKGIAWVTVLLLGYSLFLSRLGFLLATFFLMVFLLRTSGPLKWWVTLLIALLTSVLTYWVFGVWLSVPFPRGLLSF